MSKVYPVADEQTHDEQRKAGPEVRKISELFGENTFSLTALKEHARLAPLAANDPNHAR